MRVRSHLILAVFLTGLFSLSAPGQVPVKLDQQSNDSPFTVSVDVQLVQLPVAVFDPRGRVVTGLTKEDFQIFEDRVVQEVTLFKHEDIPVSLGLVIDNSGSMRNKRERVNRAALTFVRESNPQDETFIVNFDSEVYLEQEFTNAIDDLVHALRYTDTRGETALYDAVHLSVDHMRIGTKDKKALLLISDGEDNSSRYRLEKVVEALRKSNVTLYAIGLLEENDQRGGLFRKSPSSKAREALVKFAEASGGQAYFPKSLDEIDDLCKRIAHDLRDQYTIGYTPTNKKLDGSWRQVVLKVNPRRTSSKVTVRTKPGYYAPLANPSEIPAR
jgi:Ca-activated chloride channel homolog